MSSEQQLIEQAKHVGKMDTLWEVQQRVNEEIKIKINTFEKRLTSVEKRILVFTTGAATLGSILGPIIMKMFS